MYNTTKYINVLSQIVHAYNNTYHSGIKKIPNEVEDIDNDIIELTNKKYNKAKQEETKFNVGDSVRYIVNKKQFEKGTLPKWSKIIHKIVSQTEHTYTLDNGKMYKYYELQLVNSVESISREAKEPTREEMKKKITSLRRFNKEGLDKSMIID